MRSDAVSVQPRGGVDLEAVWERYGAPAAVTLAACILIAPLWQVVLPAMPDLPAHLASFHLLSGAASDPHLAPFYRIDWQFVPNLASEIAVPVLSHVFGLVVSAKIFLSAAVALWVAGAALVQRALFGRVGFGVLPAAFFAYNANFFWGFMNYDFASGAALVLFAAWIATASWTPLRRLPPFAAAVLLLYFCHVFAAAVLLLMIGAFELDRRVREGRVAMRSLLGLAVELAIVSVPAMIAFVFLRPAGASGGRLEFNYLLTWDDRLGAAMQTRFDEPAFLFLAVMAIVYAFCLGRRQVEIHPAMRGVLIALFVAAALMPEWAMGGWGVDLRIPPVFGALLFASSSLRLDAVKARALAIGVVLLLAWNASAVGGFWAYYDRQYTEFRQALSQSPTGTRLMLALDGSAMGNASDQPYWHMAEFAILDRKGFSPLLFTTPGQHVVRLQPAWQPYAAATAQQGSPPDVGELADLAAGEIDGDKDIRDTFPYLMHFQCRFDEVVVIRSEGPASPVPDMLRLRHRGSFFDLYDVRRDASCA
jgi:hypothetical protein